LNWLPTTGGETLEPLSPNDTGNDVLTITFDDNRLIRELVGQHDRHLALIEDRLGVHLTPRGNRIAVAGPEDMRQAAQRALETLYERLQSGHEVTTGDVEGAVRMAAAPPAATGQDDFRASMASIKTPKRIISARSPAQADYIRALQQRELVFGTGPAGTGKTYLAVACAAAALARGTVERIVLSRPAVEAGERLGFLPGDMREKVDPYLRPLYDALYDVLPGPKVARGLDDGTIEIAPLAFMRGRTLNHAFIILDEAQNCTRVQMKMFLTRLGEGSRMVITGDPSQVDLPEGVRSGLSEATRLLADFDDVPQIVFTDADVVRHPLVARIVRAYDAAGRRRPEESGAQDS